MGPTISARRRQLLGVAVGAALAVAPTLAAMTGAPAPRVLAGCNDIVDTTDSFSMNCVPTVIPDTSDQLTEAEVAEPGWNASPGGGGGHR
ncbi:MAG: hypothetical protein KIH64_004690 [Mycobacterium sp.]|nr:hypothetical protein [Mycobacterium sp.]